MAYGLSHDNHPPFSFFFSPLLLRHTRLLNHRQEEKHATFSTYSGLIDRSLCELYLQ